MQHWTSGLAGLFVAAILVGPGVVATAQDAPAVEAKDVLATAEEAGTFETLLQAIDAAELTETLRGEGPFTLFAPTDAAFAKLPEGELEALFDPENQEQLIDLLKYHVVAEGLFIDYAVAAGAVETVQGQSLQVEASDGKVLINGEAEVIDADITASNGMLHAIDTLLIPPVEDE